MEVCDGEKCKKCGEYPAVGNGEWGVLKCGGKKGLQGSSVKVAAPTNYLQIAEAEILGSSKTIFFPSIENEKSSGKCNYLFILFSTTHD